MLPDLDELRAYVDGELPPQRRAEVEAAIAANAELAAQAQTLFASRLPYQSAFAQVPIQPVPKALQARVAELASVATASQEMRFAGAGGPAPSGHPRGSSGVWLAWLLAGLIVGGVAAQRIGQSAAPAAEPWVLKVGSYHSMYARETVLDDEGAGLAQASVLKQRLRQQLGLALKVPDLSAQGLRFVRAQQLQFEGRLVLQLVYLPKQGLPVALCLTPAQAQPERALELNGLQAVTWQNQGWAYVLIGSLPMTQLQALRREMPAALT